MHDGGFGGIIHLREPTVQEIAASKLRVRASCQCGHSRDLHPDRICISQATEVSDVGSVLKCSKCGTRGLSTRVAPRD